MKLHLWGLVLGVAVAQQNAVAQEVTITQTQAIERALDASPDIRASAESSRAATGARLQASVRPNPTLQFDAENIAGSAPFNGLDSGEYTYSLGQKVERGGKRAARMLIADADVDLAYIDETRTRLDVTFEVRNAYIDALVAAARLSIAEEKHKLGRDLERAVQRRVSSARDPEATLLRVRARTLELRADRDIAREALIVAKRRLSSFWGEPAADYGITVAELFTQPEKLLTSEQAIESSPTAATYSALKVRAEAALQLELANAKQDPTVSIGVRQLAGDDALAGVVSLSMPLAFFNTNEGAIASARAERKRADWNEQAGLMRLKRKYRTILGEKSAAFAEARTIRAEIIPQAEKALSAARRGYDRGAFTYLDVTEAQRALTDLNSREIDALKRLHKSEIALDHLTGLVAESEETE